MSNKLNYFKTNDATYAYRVSGQGDPLVLLHGFTGSMFTWDYFIEKWRDHYQIITVDLPGHGRTNIKKLKTMQLFSEDLDALLQSLNIAGAHFLGYSMGGRTALSFYYYKPKRVLSLILESASPGLKTEQERDERIKQDEKIMEKITGNLTDFVNLWESLPLFASHKQLPESVKQDLRAERLMQSPNGLIQSLQGMGTGHQPSWWDRLKEITVPVLLITGELDEKFVKLNEGMKQAIPNSKHEIILNSGHTPHLENKEAFQQSVFTFIKNFNK